MASKRLKLSPKAALPFKTANKHKRQDLYVKQKKARESSRREERFRRRKEEDKNPTSRQARLQRNVPLTLERKRVWDQVDNDTESDLLGLSVDVAKRQKLEEEEKEEEEAAQGTTISADGENKDEEYSRNDEEDGDSMIDSATDTEEDEEKAASQRPRGPRTATERANSPTQSTTSTNLNLMPEALAAKFPSLFSQDPPPTPKILITTSINSTLHDEARLLTTLFPNSVYIPRSAHRYGHKFSIREISSFATNRNYTTVVVLMEDQKRPSGIDFVHLPNGPMFHFSVSSWVNPKVLPGHGRPQSYYPELILNNFRTPLGLLTAHLFRSLLPSQPEFLGRQVLSITNSRDWIFLRFHRYLFREKRETEKAVVGGDGKEMPGAQGIRVGLQELGPRLTMKLRRIDKGIQQSSGQQWEWKGKTDRVRTKFQL